jgi:hypothetical protein
MRLMLTTTYAQSHYPLRVNLGSRAFRNTSENSWKSIKFSVRKVDGNRAAGTQSGAKLVRGAELSSCLHAASISISAAAEPGGDHGGLESSGVTGGCSLDRVWRIRKIERAHDFQNPIDSSESHRWLDRLGALVHVDNHHIGTNSLLLDFHRQLSESILSINPSELRNIILAVSLNKHSISIINESALTMNSMVEFDQDVPYQSRGHMRWKILRMTTGLRGGNWMKVDRSHRLG